MHLYIYVCVSSTYIEYMNIHVYLSTNEYRFQESGKETKSASLLEKGSTDGFSFRFF